MNCKYVATGSFECSNNREHFHNVEHFEKVKLPYKEHKNCGDACTYYSYMKKKYDENALYARYPLQVNGDSCECVKKVMYKPERD